MKRYLKQLLALFAIICLGNYLFKIILNDINMNYYVIKKHNLQSIRIVQLSDIHELEFGSNNQKLIEKVISQNPDIICMTGDMQNASDEDTSIVENLVNNLSQIAPVYYGMGNHEIHWERNFSKDFSKIIENAGGIVVNKSYVDVDINGNALRIGGYMGYYGTPHMTEKDEKEQEKDKVFMADFENTDRYKILLDHIPTSWVNWRYIDKYPVDLVLSGHYHGGQIKIPFIGPLYVPYIGFFPKDTEGMFAGEKGICIISTGLGSEYWWLPRINNPPEIVVVDFVP